jgi:hypothetical protein
LADVSVTQQPTRLQRRHILDIELTTCDNAVMLETPPHTHAVHTHASMVTVDLTIVPKAHAAEL